jgi:aldehyde:ferredoxin oxidoreductase
VLGAKRVKAIAVRGDRRTPLADPERTVSIAKRLSARSFGPATEKYRELGTVANLLVFNRFEALPTRNFSAGQFEGAARLAAEDLAPGRRVTRKSCAACTIGCEHAYSGGPGKSGAVRMEYESLFALGPLCGVDEPSAVIRAAAVCDEAGLDTISTGGTIAFLMDCSERGLIDARLPSGRALRFGDGEAVVEAIQAITGREGIGALLALGSRRAAERIGEEATSLAMHVKGLEMPGYDPRALQSMALGLAVGTRGADHNRSGAYEADFSARVDRRRGGPDSVAAAVESEDRSALIDSLILCKFLRGVFDDLFAESAEMLDAVTGWGVSADELRRVARRVVNARKCVNEREGWTSREDTLPDRLLLDGPDVPESPGLPRARLASMIAHYYRLRGWDGRGCVPRGLRHELDLDSAAFGRPTAFVDP